MIFIFDFLFGPDKSPEEIYFNAVMSIATILGVAITILAIVMWIKKDRMLKRMAKDKVNETFAVEILKLIQHNLSSKEIREIIQKEIWPDKEVYVEEIKTEIKKEISQQRIIKISVEDENENSGFKSFYVKLTPNWLLDFIQERRDAANKQKRKK